MFIPEDLYNDRLLCETCKNDKFHLVLRMWGVIKICTECGAEGCFEDPDYDG